MRLMRLSVLYLDGGIDSYNVLVPHSDCPSKDMFAHYETWRGDVKLPRSSLLEINATATSHAMSAMEMVQVTMSKRCSAN